MASKERCRPTEKRADSEEMESESEHWVIPREDAVVKSVKPQKKLHRGQKATAGQRGKPKELTQGDCEFGRKLTVACAAGGTLSGISGPEPRMSWGSEESGHSGRECGCATKAERE
jgi:hypothetical protein